jgi:hypothetical protein
MRILDRQKLVERYTQNPISHTKNGKPFRVSRITDSAIYMDLPSGEQYVSRTLLEAEKKVEFKRAVGRAEMFQPPKRDITAGKIVFYPLALAPHQHHIRQKRQFLNIPQNSLNSKNQALREIHLTKRKQNLVSERVHVLMSLLRP